MLLFLDGRELIWAVALMINQPSWITPDGVPIAAPGS
jgi:hypothetical protein